MKIRNIKNVNLKKLGKTTIFTLVFSVGIGGCSSSKINSSIDTTSITTSIDYIEPTVPVEIETTQIIEEVPTASVYPEHYEPTSESETTTFIEETTHIIKDTTIEDTTITTTQIIEEVPTASLYPEPYQPTSEIETTTQQIETTIEPPIEIVNEKKLIGLTFDDGPSKYTSELVKILDENNASATFFLVGRSIKRYSDSVKEAYLAGNEIAVHTYTHTSFKKMTIEEILDEINRTRALIEGIDVEWSNLVRPPYGSITNEIVESIDTSFILWNIDTRDWESRDKEAIKQEVAKAIKDGSIILLHDTYPETIEAVREILPMYSDEYEFVSVSELFLRNQKKLEENKKYYKLK